MSQSRSSCSPWGSRPLFWLCPAFRGTRTGRGTDTAEEEMVPTTARTMAAVAACGDRVRGRLPRMPATRLLAVQAGSVSRATPLRRCRPRSYRVPRVREARQWSVATVAMASRRGHPAGDSPVSLQRPGPPAMIPSPCHRCGSTRPASLPRHDPAHLRAAGTSIRSAGIATTPSV